MRGVVFTFDDDVISHYKVIRPLFEGHGFQCTFFINGSKKNMWKRIVDINGVCYNLPDMDDFHIADLHRRGFEIGNHTFGHDSMLHMSEEEMVWQIRQTEEKVTSLGITCPTTFAYPGYGRTERVEKLLGAMGYKFARIGYVSNTFRQSRRLRHMPYKRQVNDSYYYIPGKTNPYSVPCCGIFNHRYTFDMFRTDIDKAPDGSYCVFAGHVFELDSQIRFLERVCQFCYENRLRVYRLKEMSYE